MDLRELILTEMAKRGLKKQHVFNMIKYTGIYAPSVFNYLNGVHDMRGKYIGAILEALNADVRF